MAACLVVIFTLLWPVTRFESILSGALSMFLVFLFVSVQQLAKDDAGLIARTGVLFMGLTPVILVLITSLIGMISGIFASLLGYTLAERVRNA